MNRFRNPKTVSEAQAVENATRFAPMQRTAEAPQTERSESARSISSNRMGHGKLGRIIVGIGALTIAAEGAEQILLGETLNQAVSSIPNLPQQYASQYSGMGNGDIYVGTAMVMLSLALAAVALWPHKKQSVAENESDTAARPGIRGFVSRKIHQIHQSRASGNVSGMASMPQKIKIGNDWYVAEAEPQKAESNPTVTKTPSSESVIVGNRGGTTSDTQSPPATGKPTPTKIVL